MANELTSDQFKQALADAVAGVLTVYREVEAMLRELGAALADEKPAFTPFGSNVVPGVRKNPDARYLRNYLAAFYQPAEDDVGDEDEDEPEDEGEDDEEDVPAKQKKRLSIATGSGLLIARAAIYERGVASFEPSLLVGALTQCRVEPEVPAGSLLKLPRSRLRSLVRSINDHGSAGKRLRTNIPVQVEGQPKGKVKHRLVFEVAQPLVSHRLFDVTPDRILDIARTLRTTWSV